MILLLEPSTFLLEKRQADHLAGGEIVTNTSFRRVNLLLSGGQSVQGVSLHRPFDGESLSPT